MKKIVFILLSVFLFAGEYYENDLKLLNSEEFQKHLDKKLQEIETEYLSKDKAKEQLKLLTKLNENTSKLPPNELVKDYINIINLTKNTQIDSKTTFAGAKLEGKNVVLEYYIKDDERMRKNFQDKKFKNTVYKALKYSQERVTCNSWTPFLEKIFNAGYRFVYRYKFKSDKKKIFDVVIDKNSCVRW